jgi:hypothetical protein
MPEYQKIYTVLRRLSTDQRRAFCVFNGLLLYLLYILSKILDNLYDIQKFDKNPLTNEKIVLILQIKEKLRKWGEIYGR